MEQKYKKKEIEFVIRQLQPNVLGPAISFSRSW